ncbi:hypothetical protein P4S72_20690 [Vibrio sp. PP-XX7]
MSGKFSEDEYMEIRAYEAKDKHQVIFLWNECGLVVPQNDPEKALNGNFSAIQICFWSGFKRTK